ncbi:MAG: F0F1 ATP synthase subunit B [Candidatus Anaerobiospirillum merdipullorum]|uniref:ATP synthase subunit b n=1 Tax=Candidatus Anaerobiospirillum merdipullorum TaxID=2838450 RepID=A0A9E2KNH2_9GAMM|nr:F0F1 ATP synthase subunit B [Candidatus Anaerobiospirillum merdipullorum]
MEINATFLGQAVAFVIFALLCMKWVWPPLMRALEKRQQEIAEGLAAAEKAKKNLELAKSGSAETLRQAKQQAQQIIDAANKQRSQILDKAAQEAQAEKSRMLEAARSEIEAEKNKAREELRAEVAALALAGAQKILLEKADAQSDRALVKKIADAL